MIELRLRRQQGDFSLDLDVRCTGRVIGLFGPSGSGKTTVLNCVAGIADPAEARISIGGRLLQDTSSKVGLPARRRGIGYVFQDALLFDHMSVRANVLYGRRGGNAESRLTELAEILEIGPLLDRRPLTLSVGEKRRVAIARALMSSPDLLLLDEPLSGLDAPIAGRILGYLAGLLERITIPAIYVSHMAGEIVFLCDEALSIRSGRITAQGPPREVVLFGSTPETHSAGITNTFRVLASEYQPAHRTVQADIGGCILLGYPSRGPEKKFLTCSVRACDIILAATPPTAVSARNILPGTIREIRPFADRHLVIVDAGPQWLVEISAAGVDALHLAPGQVVHMIVKATAVTFH